VAVNDMQARQREFWQAACHALSDLMPTTEHQVWHFGDSEPLARDLADLVLRGPKRATAGLLWDAEIDPSMMPVQGGYSLVTDHGGAPLLIIRTTQVEIRPYREVDADFAAAEGEGDGSLAYWRKAHWSYFSHRCEALCRTLSDDMPVILERFALVYPVASS
jgi:uncharacterized protein YhfF